MESISPPPSAGVAELNRLFALQKKSQREDGNPTFEVRQARLKALQSALLKHKDALAEAVDADFGGRSRHETLVLEIYMVLEAIKNLRRHLRDWMCPRQRPMSWVLLPAKAKVVLQPLGLVGIIGPWNYPVQLSLVPLATAVAAGNRVLLKPSEFTPSTNKAITELLKESLPEDVAAVTPGAVDVAVAFSQKPFDHLFFTGSTTVGRHVMRAAADNLTPVTLELGGKSPAIVHESYPITMAAERIAFGKLINAGQTCIAPDYALIPRARVDEFVTAFQKCAQKSYPRFLDNADFSAIVNERHYRRLQELLTDAADKGAQIIPLNHASETQDDTQHKMIPVLVLNGTDEMALLQDEIFGPILPVLPYDTLDDALAYVNDRPRPLALYYFDHDKIRVEQVLAGTTSGGVTVNDTVLHVAAESLPFGGVGPSGMGSYHGQEGFETFSHKKGVLLQSRISTTSLVRPPYGRVFQSLMKFLVR
jgi:coniferyl-aldehyde dehydrogenase